MQRLRLTAGCGYARKCASVCSTLGAATGAGGGVAAIERVTRLVVESVLLCTLGAGCTLGLGDGGVIALSSGWPRLTLWKCAECHVGHGLHPHI